MHPSTIISQFKPLKAEIFLRKFSISKKLFWILFIQLIFILLCYLYIIYSSVISTKSQMDTSIYQMNYTLIHYMESKNDMLDTITKFPILNSFYGGANNLMPYLIYPQKLAADNYTFEKFFSHQTSSLISQFPSLVSVMLYNLDGNPIAIKETYPFTVSKENKSKADWFKSSLSGKGSLYLLENSQIPNTGYYRKDTVLFGYRSVVYHYSLKPVAVILASVEISDMLLSFERQRIFPEQRFAIFNKNKNILLEQKDFALTQLDIPRMNSSNFNFTREYNNKEFDYHVTFDPKLQIYSVIQTPHKAMISSSSPISQFFLWTAGFIIITFSFIVFTLIVGSITDPIKKLVLACNKIGKGDFSVRIGDPALDELGYLSTSFDKMSSQLQVLINQIYLKEITERELELQMLRSQINPHFLCNTLENMRMNAYMKGAHDVAQMNFLLAQLLRYGVYHTNSSVPVSEEILHLQEYIELQKYCIKDNITISVNVDEKILKYDIIKLVLQPLVENAINHGIFYNRKGSINVWGYEQNGCLEFIVSDNGIGIEADKLNLLMDYIDNRNNHYKSIGLKNVHRRVQLYYGKEYGLTIRSVPHQGTSVTLRVPVLENNKPNNDYENSNTES